MKNWFLITIIIFFGAGFASSQCLSDRHSATWYDGWISCNESTNPNEARERSHWIQYDLGEEYYLYEMKVWNMNAPDILDYGLKDVYIDLSDDGTNWIEFGQYTFSQSPGENDFEGIVELSFEGIQARYVLITAINNYGAECYGLSEINIRARERCPLDYVAWIGNDGDWDVASNWCNDHIPTAQDKVWIPKEKTVTIPNGYIAEAFRLDLENSSSIVLEGELRVSEE